MNKRYLHVVLGALIATSVVAISAPSHAGRALSYTSSSSPGPGKIYVRLGSRGRIEQVKAWVLKSNLGGGSSTDSNSRRFSRRLGCFLDDAGHAIANALGGSGRIAKNLFPQNPNYNRGRYKDWEGKIRSLVADGRKAPVGAKITLTFSYGSPGKPNRPRAIKYEVQYGRGFSKRMYQTFSNPLPKHSSHGICCL